MLLDGLVALKLITKTGEFYHNAAIASACLVPGRPSYQGHIIRHQRNSAESWPFLPEALRSGQAVRDPREAFPPDRLRAFILGMSDIGKFSARDILSAVDLSRYRRVLDAGGGPGTYSIAFLQAYPRMHATVFDRPDVLEIAREQARNAGVEDRCTFQAGDLATDTLGNGYDLVFVSNIIHSFGPAANQALVRKCYDALVSGGHLILKDFLVENDRSGPPFSLLFALRMLLATGEGDTYTYFEVAEWTRAAGFKEGRVIDLTPQTRLWLVEKP
jgi:SAM-dependent methyltransferase